MLFVSANRATCLNIVEAVPAVDVAVEAAPVLLSPTRQDLVEQVHKEAATFAAVVGADQHITNEGSQDTAGLKITDDSHATTVVASATS